MPPRKSLVEKLETASAARPPRYGAARKLVGQMAIDPELAGYRDTAVEHINTIVEAAGSAAVADEFRNYTALLALNSTPVEQAAPTPTAAKPMGSAKA